MLGVVPITAAAQSQPDSPEPVVTVQAVRLTTALNVDGQLSEEIYSSVRPRSEFIQQEPVEGVAATERTDVWVFFDKDTLFLSFRCARTTFRSLPGSSVDAMVKTAVVPTNARSLRPQRVARR